MLFRRFALLLVVVSLVACNNEKNRNLLDRRTDQAIRMGQEAQQPAPKKTFNPLQVSDKMWAGNTSVQLRRGVPLPSKYEGGRGVTLISSEPLSLSDIAAALGGQTGIPFRLEGGIKAGGASGPSDSTMPVSYEGPLSGLLDIVAGNYGINWKYDGWAVRFSRFETRVFTVEALPGTLSVKDGMKEDTGGGSSSSSSSEGGGSFSVGSGNSLKQSAEMSSEIKVWDDIEATVTGMLGGVGKAVVSPSSGTVTVSTTPEIMALVAKYLSEENKRLTRQVAINVEVYSVTLNDEADFTVSFDAVLKKMGAITLDGTPATSAADSAGLGTLTLGIIDTRRFGTVTSIFSALSQIGDATRVTQFPLTTLNNRTVTRRVGSDRSYVASLSNSTSTSSSFSSSSVVPGTITEGFSLQVTPRILDNGMILMQYSMSMIDIKNVVSFDTGAGKVQLPETGSRVFSQQSMLKSGTTLVIGGHDDEIVSQKSSGMGNAYNYFLGGGSANSKQRSMMFLAITPQVIDVGMKTEQE